MATQLDYYNTFLSHKSGQEVYYDLRRIVFEWFKDRAMVAEVQVALDELMKIISENCGINTAEAKMKMIKHEATVAASQLEAETGDPEDKDLHETH